MVSTNSAPAAAALRTRTTSETAARRSAPAPGASAGQDRGPASAAPTRVPGHPRRRSRRGRPARTSPARRTGRCRSDPARAPAGGRRPGDPNRLSSRPVAGSNDAGPDGELAVGGLPTDLRGRTAPGPEPQRCRCSRTARRPRRGRPRPRRCRPPARRRRSARSRPRRPRPAARPAAPGTTRRTGRHGRHHQHALLDHPAVQLAAGHEPQVRRCRPSGSGCGRPASVPSRVKIRGWLTAANSASPGVGVSSGSTMPSITKLPSCTTSPKSPPYP